MWFILNSGSAPSKGEFFKALGWSLLIKSLLLLVPCYPIINGFIFCISGEASVIKEAYAAYNNLKNVSTEQLRNFIDHVARNSSYLGDRVKFKLQEATTPKDLIGASEALSSFTFNEYVRTKLIENYNSRQLEGNNRIRGTTWLHQELTTSLIRETDLYNAKYKSIMDLVPRGVFKKDQL